MAKQGLEAAARSAMELICRLELEGYTERVRKETFNVIQGLNQALGDAPKAKKGAGKWLR